MQHSQTNGLSPREMILAKFGVCMQSSSTVLSLSDSTIAARPISAEAATHNERRLVLGGQMRVHDSCSPVSAIRSERPKHDPVLSQLLFRIGWVSGRKFWPCAELDNRW